MNLSILFDQSYILLILIGITCLILSLFIFICVYLYIRRINHKKQSNVAITKKRLLYSSETSTTKLENPPVSSSKIIFETIPKFNITEVPSNYQTFDLAKRNQRHLSSDSSYTSSNHRLSYPSPSFTFNTIKSKIQRLSTPSPILARSLETINSEQISLKNLSDSDEQDTESIVATPSFEYSLIELFRIEMIYKLHYSIEDKQLLLQLIRLESMQPLIERCFPSFICKIRLYTNNDKHKTKKYYSKKDPINEIFKFDLDQFTLEQSYLKIHILGYHKNDKRIELGHTVLVLNQYDNLMIRSGHHHDKGLAGSDEHMKSITLYEDRIDMITQYQVKLIYFS